MDYPSVKWFDGVGEQTGMESGAFDLVTFGSSFNVCDQAKALIESDRILKPHGWFACMWNHRDLTDSLQSEIEKIITRHVEGYSYGRRREDQTEIIRQSELFLEPVFIQGFGYIRYSHRGLYRGLEIARYRTASGKGTV